MTAFWIICALLLVVALAFVMWPLWRGMAKNNQVARDAANLEIFRDQLAEMDADLGNGLLTPELYEQGKRELEARLLDEVRPEAQGGGVPPRNPLKILAMALAVVIPLASVGLYWKLGNQNVFLPPEQQVNVASSGALLSEAGIKELEIKLEKNPNVPDDWVLLARSYAQLERWPDAAKAYEKLTELVPNEAQVWAEYADVMAMVHGKTLIGPPTELLDKALALDPNNLLALSLSGSAAMERGDYPAAVHHWEALLKQLPPDSQDAQVIEAGLDQARDFLARSQGGRKQTKAAQTSAQDRNSATAGNPATLGNASISGMVTLGDALKGKTSPDDTVFIIARAADGPPMPLAVVRKLVKDLPTQFTLDDSMAMAPQMKLSGFDKVVVIARVSKSGDATAQPGDLQGMSSIVKPGASALKISIDSVVK